MRVVFLVHSLGLWGGVGVVVEHARRLRLDHGVDAQIVLSSLERVADWGHSGLGDVPVRSLDEGRQECWDIAVATWWETVFTLHRLRADRYAFFVQSMEERLYDASDPARAAAALTHDLPLSFITEARWIAAQLGDGGKRVFYVRNGIDKSAFTPSGPSAVRSHGPLRILVEGSPAVPMKGVTDALLAAAEMKEPHTVTLVAADRAAAQAVIADRIVGPLTSPEMATTYREHDVVLKLSRIEGMFGPPLEGFHCGATCVVTPVTGHDEYVVDGWNGLVVGWDDVRGTARTLDLLARDRRLLHMLRTNALATARVWPSTRQSAEVMKLALRRIAEEPTPDPTASAARLAAGIRIAMESYAAEGRDHARLQARVARVERIFSKTPALRAARRVAGRMLSMRQG